MKPATSIIKQMILTEKGTVLKQTGGAPKDQVTEGTVRPKILFEVATTANKIEIKKAVETLFSVSVVDVHTQIVRGKLRRLGRFTGRRSSWKKATVTLAAGSKTEMFEGV